jgi:hypothetical protein
VASKANAAADIENTDDLRGSKTVQSAAQTKPEFELSFKENATQEPKGFPI